MYNNNVNQLTELTRMASSFRLYLRNRYYSTCQNLIFSKIYQNMNDILDIDYNDDTFQYLLRCKRKKVCDIDTYYAQFENVLLSIINSDFMNFLSVDDTLDNNSKYAFKLIANHIMTYQHNSLYLKLLYQLIIMDMSSTNKIIVVSL